MALATRDFPQRFTLKAGLKIAVLEAEYAGFSASGRKGVSSSGSSNVAMWLAHAHELWNSSLEAKALVRALIAHAIDCEFTKDT